MQIDRQEVSDWMALETTKKFLAILEEHKTTLALEVVQTAPSNDCVWMARGSVEIINRILDKDLFDDYYSDNIEE